MLSRICESFRCTPSEAQREIDRDPQLVFAILETRAYEQVRSQVLNAQKEEDVPKGPMTDLVVDIEFELLQERNERLSG